MSFFRKDGQEDGQNLYRIPESAEECLERSQTETVLILKHSTICPISKAGKNQVDRFLQDQPAAAYLVVVQDNRALSNRIAEQLKIKHESPQLIVLKNGAPAAVFNHHEITEENIRQAAS